MIADRLLTWTARRAAAHPLPAALFMIVLAALIVLGITGSGAASTISWVAAGALAVGGALVGVAGFANFRVARLRARLRRRQRVLSARLDAAEAGLRGRQADATRVAGLHADTTRVAERLDAVIARVAAISDELAARARQGQQAQQALSALVARIERTERENISLDLASVLRHLGPLLVGGASRDAEVAAQSEHGHSLLMALLVDDARRAAPSSLVGKTLVEVGTTRERDPWQGSTEKLAILTALIGMDFVTVDVDPDSTAAAKRLLAHLNPSARAITMKGEDYLAGDGPALDYVYLDAFDFDHGTHSEQRRQRYRELLDTEINDPDSWRMHELCARALIARMPLGGAVVIDDTWTDDNGELAGKGKTAVPLLQANGFEIEVRRQTTIALRRTSAGPSPAPA